MQLVAVALRFVVFSCDRDRSRFVLPRPVDVRRSDVGKLVPELQCVVGGRVPRREQRKFPELHI